MGTTASALGPETVSISLDKAKELAGDLWTEELQAKFNTEWEVKEGLTLKDLRRIAPLLFVLPDEPVDLKTIQDITSVGGSIAGGAEWNDVFQTLFDDNSTDVPAGETPDGEVAPSVQVEVPAAAAAAAAAAAPAPVDTAPAAAGEATKAITFAVWKTLLPSVFETEEERDTRVTIEFRAHLAKRAEGNIVINYQTYNEEFPVSKNCTTSERIDEDYGLTDVMPGCQLKLSTIDSSRRTKYETEHDGRIAPWVKEEPAGVFQELLAGETYYLLVIEDPAQYKQDMADLQGKLSLLDKDTESNKPRQEGCSCLYGNPCQDPYVCLDWDNRWQVSIDNGLSKEEIKRAGFAVA